MISARSALFILCLLSRSIVRSQTSYELSAPSFTVTEGDQMEVTLTRSATASQDQAIVVVIEESAADDFIGASQVAVFQPSDLTSSVLFSTINDDLPEPTENFTVTLQSTSSDVVFGDQSAALIIIPANDDAAGIFSFQNVSRLMVSEGDNVQLTVVRTAGAFGEVTIDYEIPESIDDISPSTGSVTFIEGQRSAVIDLTVIDDTTPENDESFPVRLSTDQLDVSITDSVRQVSVLKNDAPVHFILERQFVIEQAMQYATQIQVVRGKITSSETEQTVGPIDTPVSVTYSVTANSAIQNQDFLLDDGVVVFNPGEIVKNISVLILSDDLPELEEGFQIELITITGEAVITSPSVTSVRISANDDQHGVIRFDPSQEFPVYIDEDQSEPRAVLDVLREGGTYGQINFTYTVSPTTQGGESDITPLSGMITMSDGESSASITMDAIADDEPELSESFTVRLTSVTGGARFDGTPEGTVIIQDSDEAHGAVQWIHGAANINSTVNPRTVSWTVERSGGMLSDVLVTFTSYYADESGVVVPNTLTSNGPYQVVILDGTRTADIEVEINDSAFLDIGGSFEVLIDEVKLLNGKIATNDNGTTSSKLNRFTSIFVAPEIPSFNSPYKGERRTDVILVTSSDANGEIGFSDVSDLIVTEPDSGISQISVALSREGTSGTATVSWSLNPLMPTPISADDVTTLSGVISFAAGSSSAIIQLEVLADDLSETEEYMTLSLQTVDPSDTQRLRANFTQKKIIIAENDNPGGVFQLDNEGSIIVDEGETFSLTISRTDGDLVARSLFYTMSGEGNSEFFGSTGLITFNPGEREKTLVIITGDDDIPEIDETFTFSITSHGDPEATLGVPRTTTVTVRENDSPYGQLHFVPDSNYRLYESKASNVSSVEIPVIRDRGTFGNISVSWQFIAQSPVLDLTPVSGVVIFSTEQSMGFISISSVPDQLPEGIETFTLELSEPTGGSELSSPANISVSIVNNDVAVYFQSPGMVEAIEGGFALLTVKRSDSTKAAGLSYKTTNGTAQSNDYEQVVGDLEFAVGQDEASIQISIYDDNDPESVEFFYVELFNPRGDIVIYNITEALVIIKANDNANGVFRFGGPYVVSAKEGDDVLLGVIRDEGAYRAVSLRWKITDINGTELVPGEQFGQVTGSVRFSDGQTEATLSLTVLSDGLPEYDEIYTVQLFNLTGGGPGDQEGILAQTHTTVDITILTNDDPKGVFAFSSESRERTVAEEYTEGKENTTTTTFEVVRSQGLSGDVEVLWEVYSGQLAGILPAVSDLLFLSEPRAQLQAVTGVGREGTQSTVYNFTGETESYAMVDTVYIQDWMLTDFALSVWVRPAPGCNGYILTKASISGALVYYSVRMTGDTQGLPVTVTLSMLDQQTMALTTAQVIWSAGYSQSGWQHLLINVQDSTADFIFNGVLASQKIVPITRVDNSGPLFIGSTVNAQEKYTGLIQDLRLFDRNLSPVEVIETVTYPSRLDVEPISGVLSFIDGQATQSLNISALDDVEAESNEVFSIILITGKGGARISSTDSLAKLTVLKSDNANGLFGFEGLCQPLQVVTEGSSFSCVVRRERGDAGTVIVQWRIDQFDTSGTVPNVDDFNNSSGEITFNPGQLTQTIEFESVSDSLPELQEDFAVVLVTALATDGLESTPTSGASIDLLKSKSNISIVENDLPNGLLQFSNTGSTIADGDVIPIAENQPEIRTSESVGIVRLLVERAQGIIGNVSVEWRTEDGSAKSSGASNPDYVSLVGTVRFSEGQRYAYINITILDDNVAEDDKFFLVHLVNPSGGAVTSVGSTAKVIILNSDDAYGIVRFDPVSQNRLVSEMETQPSNITLNVIRDGGLIGNTVVHWFIVDDSDDDFVYDSGQVEINDGQSGTTITVVVRPDLTPELDEIFQVLLSNVSQGRLGDEPSLIAAITILANDDPYGMFTISQTVRTTAVPEASSSEVNITVIRTQGMVGVVDVTYRTVSPSNQSPYYPVGVTRATEDDYISTNGTITFQENQTAHYFALTIQDDELPEPDESFFVELTTAYLVSGGQERPLADSPILGAASEIFAQIVIEANDNAHGILSLSASAIGVDEQTTEPLLYVNRSAGAFGMVSVRIDVIPGNATASVDYFYTSNNVVLSDEETRKQVPIYINDDSFPELSETFTVRLLPYVTGGATLGEITECIVTILPSDDPQGAFEFSSGGQDVDEPETVAEPLAIRVNRMGGSMQIVAVQWTAVNDQGDVAEDDIEPAYGTIYFTSNQVSQDISVRIKPDVIPEQAELITFNLTLATNGGRIGINRLFSLTIRANDNPHGTVQFSQSEYELVEDEIISTQNVSITRSGGTSGDLIVYFSTAVIDLLSLSEEMIPDGGDNLWYYQPPYAGYSNMSSGTILDKSSQSNPLQACAETCLLEPDCQSFEIDQTSLVCKWYPDTPSEAELFPSTTLTLYNKFVSRVSNLYNSQAQSGNDYQTVTSASVIIPEGTSSSSLPITILPDQLPELNERFQLNLDRVNLLNGAADQLTNEPSLGELTTANMFIRYNDDANGILRIYSRDPRALDGGQTVLVEEREHYSLELVVERTGGTIGDVSVVWSVLTSESNASRDTDYVADGATLTFLSADAVRVITIGIQDDIEPENDETFVIQLSDPQGGALLDSRSRVSVVIQANDYVAGIVGLTASSYIAKEDELIRMEVSRSLPAAGQVTLLWVISGVNQHDPTLGFNQTEGVILFLEGETSKAIEIEVLADDVPEANEEYQIYLSNITTAGVSSTGAAVLEQQTSVASITVEASNDPHGVFSFASSSLHLEMSEGMNTQGHLVVDRKFGSIGNVRVLYSIIGGHLSELNDELHPAVADVDFVSGDGFIDILEAQNSGTIPLNITDDVIPEVQEVFLVNLTGVLLLGAEDSTYQPMLAPTDVLTQVFIAANDGTRGEFEFPEELRIISLNESAQSIEIPVRRAYGAYGDVSVFIYSQTSSNAVLDQDYTFEAREIYFESGIGIKMVNLSIYDDEIPETNEAFELVLASPKGGATLGQYRTCQITITENDGAGGVVEFVNNDTITLEETFNPDGFPTAVDLELSRGPGMFGTVDISFVVVDSSGTETSQLTPSNGTIRFADQQAMTIISLSVIDDNEPELAQNLIIRISARFLSLLGAVTERTILILPSDSPNGLLSIYSATNTSSIDIEEEDNSIISCIVYRTGGLLGDISVTVATMPQSASAPAGDKLYVAAMQRFDFKSSGYCSFGDYLIVLNVMEANSSVATSSKLYRREGTYQHIADISVTKAVKCLGYSEFGQQFFVLVSERSSELVSALFTISDYGELSQLENIRTGSAVDAAVYKSEGSTYVSILNSVLTDNAQGSSLQNFVAQEDRLIMTNQIEMSSAVAIETISNLALVAQRDNVKVYAVAGSTWTLQQTVVVSNVKDITVGNSANQLTMMIASDNEIKVYIYMSGTFVSSSSLPHGGAEKINSFVYDNKLMAAVSTAAQSSILLWNSSSSMLVMKWSSNITSSLVPLTSSDRDVLFGAFKEDMSYLAVMKLLNNPDYIPSKLEIEFSEGETMKEVNVPVLDDEIPEDTESFLISLTEPNGGAALSDSAQSVSVSILSNDNAHGTIEISRDSAVLSVMEESYDSVVQLNLVRSGGSYGRVAVTWSAAADFDFQTDITPASGVVEFAGGQSVAQLSITLRADRTAENDEFINITLNEITLSGTSLPDRGATIGVLRSAMLVILANESPYGVVRWERTSMIVAEPDQMSDTVIPLTILREQGTLGAIQVTYITSRDLSSPDNSQAISGQDYISKQDSVIMSENQTRVSVDVVIKADDLPETEEQFLVNITSVRLIGVAAADIEPSIRRPGDIVTVIIAENDNARGIVQFDVERNNEGRIDVYEASGEDMPLQLKLKRDVGYFGDLEVLWQVLPREASSSDITPFSGTVTFSQGQREAYIDMTVLNDDLPEPIEMFDVQLISVTGGASLGSYRSVRVAILKNDSPNGLFGFVQTEYRVQESDDQYNPNRRVTLQVQRTQGSQGIVNVNWQMNADAIADFEPPHSGTLLYVDGQTLNNFTLTSKIDGILEGEETFVVTLTSTDNNADLSVTHRNADVIVQANPGSSGHIEVVPDYRQIVVAEPDALYSGRQVIALSRGIGTFGEVKITWSITPFKMSSFVVSEGEAIFSDGQQTTEVYLQTKDNLEPEERSTFTFQVTSATGGATVSPDMASSTIIFAASDYPYGMFEFDSISEIKITEDSAQVSLAVVRNLGVVGQVRVDYTTSPGTANRNEDFVEQTASLIFSAGQNSQAIVIRVLQDAIPEGPETFYVNLTSVTLLSSTQGTDFSTVNGIQLDLPPIVGNINSRPITIEKNDNAEGVIQFSSQSTSVQVDETVGVASLVVIRNPGSYGEVAVQYMVTAETATAVDDFFLEGGQLSFGDGQTESLLNASIVDDIIREMPEFFQVSLVSVSGGALLGTRTNSYVTIAKSDYPNGKFSIAGPRERILANPETAFVLQIGVSRSEGLAGVQTLTWRILGPNSIIPLEATDDLAYINVDDVEAVGGQFTWQDGEGDTKIIPLFIKAFSGWEIQKAFILEIVDIQNDLNPQQNGEIDPFASNVTLTILKNGDPNGILQFADVSRVDQEFLEPNEGVREVSFFVERKEGNLGDQEILWEVSGAAGDVAPMSGSILMAAGVSVAPIRINILSDDIPELTEIYQLHLRNIIGGATLRTEASTSNFTIRYNDDPHGVFEMNQTSQSLDVDPVTLRRSLRLAVSRNAGLVGSVRVTVGVTFSQATDSFPLTQSVTFQNGQDLTELTVQIMDSVFMELSSYFTVVVTEVVYLGGADVTSLPRVGEMNSVIIPVSDIAANSYVSFVDTISSVDEITQDSSISLMRTGLYGNLQVTWTQGYSPNSIPVGFTQGVISPATGTVFFGHGDSESEVTVTVLLPSLSAENRGLFAVSLLDAPFTTVGGGARLAPTDTTTEIEPSGVIRFKESGVSVHENQGIVALTIQRLYGTRKNLQITYSTLPLTALSTNDFSAAEQQTVIMMEKDTEVNITVPIFIDSLAEQDEMFMVVLNEVTVLPTTDLVASSPRISDIYPNCTVTIRANGDPYGLLDVVISPLKVVEGNLNQVTAVVRRNAGTYGHITVRLRTVGGGEAWDEQIALLAKSDSNNTISEALSSRDTRQAASAAADYQILNELLVFEQDEIEKEVNLFALDDGSPEADESVFVYLTEPTGGARIAEGSMDGMRYGYAFYEIMRNDDWNGLIGFYDNSRNVTVDEDSGGSVTLTLTRTSNADYTYHTTIQWEAVFSADPTLANDLQQSSGVIICKSLMSTCQQTIDLIDDDVPEFGYSFLVRLYNPSAGAKIDPQRGVATVRVLPSDNPYGQIEFKSDYLVVGRLDDEAIIQVDRKQGSSFRVSVSYSTERIFTDNMYRAGIKLQSAIYGSDYNRSSGTLVFDNDVDTQSISVKLTPEEVTLFSYPKVFKVVISNPQFGAVLGGRTECTVVIVDDNELEFWETQVAASVNEMDDDTIDYLINVLLDKDFTELTLEALTVLEDVLSQIIEEGEKRQLQKSAREGLISVFCRLMNSDVTVTKGRFNLIKIFERFIFTLLVGEPCEVEIDPYPRVSCKHFKFSVAKLLPQRVNEYQYSSPSRDTLKLGENVVKITTDNNTCINVQFIEYSTQHWFDKNDDTTLLNDRILAVNLKGNGVQANGAGVTSSTPSVTYRVYTPNRRRTDKRAQCVFFDENNRLWSTGNGVCRVKNELQLGTSDFVECECDHLSSYGVTSQTRDKNYIGYPAYMFIIAGSCMFCILVAVLVFLIFPSSGLFTVKLCMHQLFCTFIVLGIYLLSAYLSPDTSPDQILVGEDDNNFKCITTGVVLHYFILTQFIWIVLQSLNLWNIFTRNDEHTERYHCCYITLGYGLPAIFVGGFYGVTYYVYVQYGFNPNTIYGDVKNEREMCFLDNQYSALGGVVAPILVCGVGILIFLGDLSCRSKQWRSYDDIFKDRSNKGEIWPIVLLWFITLMCNMTGGLHMAYNYNWMMIAFCVCLVILGVYAVTYFAILRGPCSDACTKSAVDEKQQHNVSADRYASTLMVSTSGDEQLLHVPQIQYPSPNSQLTKSHMTKSRDMLALPPATSREQLYRERPWDHDSEDGLLTGSIIHRSTTGFDHSSLSRRSELPPEDDDTRDLGELILALKDDRPGTSIGHDNHGLSYTDEDDDSDTTSTNQGAYDVLRRISIADTHL